MITRQSFRFQSAQSAAVSTPGTGLPGVHNIPSPDGSQFLAPARSAAATSERVLPPHAHQGGRLLPPVHRLSTAGLAPMSNDSIASSQSQPASSSLLTPPSQSHAAIATPHSFPYDVFTVSPDDCQRATVVHVMEAPAHRGTIGLKTLLGQQLLAQMDRMYCCWWLDASTAAAVRCGLHDLCDTLDPAGHVSRLQPPEVAAVLRAFGEQQRLRSRCCVFVLTEASEPGLRLFMEHYCPSWGAHVIVCPPPPAPKVRGGQARDQTTTAFDDVWSLLQPYAANVVRWVPPPSLTDEFDPSADATVTLSDKVLRQCERVWLPQLRTPVHAASLGGALMLNLSGSDDDHADHTPGPDGSTSASTNSSFDTSWFTKVLASVGVGPLAARLLLFVCQQRQLDTYALWRAFEDLRSERSAPVPAMALPARLLASSMHPADVPWLHALALLPRTFPQAVIASSGARAVLQHVGVLTASPTGGTLAAPTAMFWSAGAFCRAMGTDLSAAEKTAAAQVLTAQIGQLNKLFPQTRHKSLIDLHDTFAAAAIEADSAGVRPLGAPAVALAMEHASGPSEGTLAQRSPRSPRSPRSGQISAPSSPQQTPLSGQRHHPHAATDHTPRESELLSARSSRSSHPQAVAADLFQYASSHRDGPTWSRWKAHTVERTMTVLEAQGVRVYDLGSLLAPDPCRDFGDVVALPPLPPSNDDFTPELAALFRAYAAVFLRRGEPLTAASALECALCIYLHTFSRTSTEMDRKFGPPTTRGGGARAGGGNANADCATPNTKKLNAATSFRMMQSFRKPHTTTTESGVQSFLYSLLMLLLERTYTDIAECYAAGKMAGLAEPFTERAVSMLLLSNGGRRDTPARARGMLQNARLRLQLAEMEAERRLVVQQHADEIDDTGAMRDTALRECVKAEVNEAAFMREAKALAEEALRTLSVSDASLTGAEQASLHEILCHSFCADRQDKQAASHAAEGLDLLLACRRAALPSVSTVLPAPAAHFRRTLTDKIREVSWARSQLPEFFRAIHARDYRRVMSLLDQSILLSHLGLCETAPDVLICTTGSALSVEIAATEMPPPEPQPDLCLVTAFTPLERARHFGGDWMKTPVPYLLPLTELLRTMPPDSGFALHVLARLIAAGAAVTACSPHDLCTPLHICVERDMAAAALLLLRVGRVDPTHTPPAELTAVRCGLSTRAVIHAVPNQRRPDPITSCATNESLLLLLLLEAPNPDLVLARHMTLIVERLVAADERRMYLRRLFEHPNGRFWSLVPDLICGREGALSSRAREELADLCPVPHLPSCLMACAADPFVTVRLARRMVAVADAQDRLDFPRSDGPLMLSPRPAGGLASSHSSVSRTASSQAAGGTTAQHELGTLLALCVRRTYLATIAELLASFPSRDLPTTLGWEDANALRRLSLPRARTSTPAITTATAYGNGPA